MKLWKRVDAQDLLLVLGVALFLGGIGHFSPAVAAIVGGLLCFLALWMMERAAAVAGKAKADGSADK